MNISKFFVDRPIFAAVLSLLVFIAGLLAMFDCLFRNILMWHRHRLWSRLLFRGQIQK